MFVPFNEPGIGAVVQAAFPANRKPVKVAEFKGPVNVNSYWSGGSKDEFALVDLVTREVYAVPTSHPYFDRNDAGERVGNLELNELPPNTALVCGGYFCGKPATVRVLLRPENVASLLPAPAEALSEAAGKALNAIVGLKGGYRADEFRRMGLGEYGPLNPAVSELAARKFVTINKAGSIAATVEGRNYRDSHR